jgi:DMSO/TMAO reductase YedYZ molybdopterin-dependent catalytic subunit
MSAKGRKLTWNRLRGTLVDSGAPPQTLDQFDAFVERRQFLGRMGKGGVAAAFLGMGAGTDAALRGLFGRGLIPEAWAQAKMVPGKPGMIVFNDRPYNGEFPAHDLDAETTPIARHFVRNNGLIPERAERKDAQGWTLTIDGEVNKPLKLTLDQLKAMPAVTYALLVECGGNGRGLFNPPVRGNQWMQGAVGCAQWTGVPLRTLLEMAGVKPSAVYTGHFGEDPPLSGTGIPLSRGVPIEKAMEPHTLVAYKMNGEDLPAIHGYPARLVVPGWIGSCSQKWLTRVWLRNTVHDGAKMMGFSYRVPAYPVAPGAKVPENDMVIATSWIVKSMITRPEPESRIPVGGTVFARGFAWAGERRVSRVLVSTDFGVSWTAADVRFAPNRYAWNRWDTTLTFPKRGYYEIWARAFDDAGGAQPFVQPWNPRGYLGNVVHRVPVMVG